MDGKIGSLQVAISIMLVGSLAAGCGSSGKSQGNRCEKLCANEAMLSCPLGDEAGCVTGCQNFYDDAKATYPDCADEIDSVFDCTGSAPVSSIQCNPNSSSPTYAAGTCSAQNTALASCMAGTTAATATYVRP